MEQNLSCHIQSLLVSPRVKHSRVVEQPPATAELLPEPPLATTVFEEMLKQQLVTINQLATQFFTRAASCANYQSDMAHRYVNTGIRLVNALKSGVETLSRVQNRGKQQITVQHINVSGDAKAMIAGSINKSGGGCLDKTAGGETDE